MMANRASREEKAQDREQTANILNSFKLNIDDVFTKVVNKMAGVPDDDASNAPSGFVDPSAARRERMMEMTGKADGPMDHHMNWEDVVARVAPKFAGKGKQRGQNRVYANNTIELSTLQTKAAEKFQPVMNELKKFKFASREDRREEQMNEVVSAVRAALRKIAGEDRQITVRDVVQNTKNAYDNAVKFFQTDTGVRVVFKVASNLVSVTASGEFSGEEIVCLENDGTKISAFVVRPQDDSFEDLTGNYDMELNVVQ
jgi:hypothetical protein